MKESKEKRIERIHRVVLERYTEKVKVVVQDNGKYFTFDYAKDPIPAETVERWEADENVTLLMVSWVEAQL